MVLLVEVIPIGVLVYVEPDAALRVRRRRRSRFWLRSAGVVLAMLLPALVAVLAPLGEQTAGPLLLFGLPWGTLVAALSRFVLFERPGSDPGSADGDDQGPGPGDGRPTPPAPIGGIPLPTQNLRRRVCATIAHCGGARVLVGRFASASASCHGCGRSGCGRRGVPYECAPATRQTRSV